MYLEEKNKKCPLFNGTQLHNMNAKINESKPLIYQGLERVVIAVVGIRKHFNQCLFQSLRTQMWLNSSFFNTSLILFSMARWAGCHDGRLVKGSFLPFPSFYSKTIHLLKNSQLKYSQFPSDSIITVPTTLLSF